MKMEQYLANKILNSALASLKLEGVAVPKIAKKYALSALLDPDTFPDALTKAHASKTKQGFCILLRMIQLLGQKPVRSFNLDTLLYIHETLFCDIRTDGGILRRVNMHKDGCEFLDYRHLPFSLNSILKQMDSIWNYDKPSRDDFAASLAHLFREMTILCPFPYGNGLTTRLFLEKFAVSNGFSLDFQSLIKDYSKVIDDAFKHDNIRALYKCILRGLSYSLTPVFVMTVPLPEATTVLPASLPAYPSALLNPSQITIRMNTANTRSINPKRPAPAPIKPKKQKTGVKKAPPPPIKKPSRVAASTKRKR